MLLLHNIYILPSEYLHLGCIDKNNQGLIAEGNFDAGVLTFKDVVIPNPGDGWGTTIWIDVYSQCAFECSGSGFWWKFEKTLNDGEAFDFAQIHKDPKTASESVDGSVVRLEFKGTVPCNHWQEYGCWICFFNIICTNF